MRKKSEWRKMWLSLSPEDKKGLTPKKFRYQYAYELGYVRKKYRQVGHY